MFQQCLALVLLGVMVRGGTWTPSPLEQLTFQYHLNGEVDEEIATLVDVVDLDMFENSAETIAALKSNGVRVICYISCGSWEEWREDHANFSAVLLGEPLDGWPGERWMDVSNSAEIEPPLRWRFEMAAAKGCEAVECDNVDGYTQNTGFTISSAEQLIFNRWFADEVRGHGMSVGLKNDLDQIGDLLQWFDFAVNEQCVQYEECELLEPFLLANKTVFGVEYYEENGRCPSSPSMSFILKEYGLSACPLFECLTQETICAPSGGSSSSSSSGAALFGML